VLLVVLGALSVVAIAYVFGLLGAPLDGFATNSQVAARISPGLIDLVAALATGLVGAFALVRSDISDTLPGVAIAISLVPPLAVVGLLLSVGRYTDAGGAALLFGTNVAAIIATGALVFVIYRVRDAAADAGMAVGRLRGWSLTIVAVMLVVVSVPLAFGTLSVVRDELLVSRVQPIAEEWASSSRWLVTNVSARKGTAVVSALGSPPDASPEELRAEMDAAGLADANLIVRLVLGGSATCPAGSRTCTTSASPAAG
jgi:uncharacterized membrane protein